MGNKNSLEFVYSVDIPNQIEPTNCTRTRRNPLYLTYLRSSPMSQARNMRELYHQCFKLYPDNQCFGRMIDGPNGKTIKYLKYREVQAMAHSIGKAILYMDLPAEVDDLLGHRLRLVGICARSRVEWQILAIACSMYNVVFVAMIQVQKLDIKLNIIKETGMEALFCSESVAKQLSKAPNLYKLQRMVFFDQIGPEITELLKPHRIDCFKYSDLLEKGQLIPFCPYPVISPTACATICFTSGTTGPPKGVMISHINITSALAVNKTAIEKAATEEGIHMSYVPLSHIFERVSMLNYFLNGARTVFSSGDLNNFKQDIKFIKPSHLPGPSVLFHKLYDSIKPKFDELEGCKKYLANSAIKSKQKKLLETGDPESFFYDMIIFRKARDELGGNMKLLASGGSYLNPQARTFLQILFSCPLFPVYGLIQCTAVNFIVKHRDQASGHVGGPTPNTEFKLVDVPEVNFFHTDKDENGVARPRGELYLRGPGIFVGYFRDPEKTKTVKDKYGWLHTGDLVEIQPKSGAIRVFGRKQNAFKLPTGQLILPQKIEQALFKSGICEQICVYGNPNKKFLVTIIVPKKQLISEIANQKLYVGSHEQLCQNMNMRRQIANRLHVFGNQIGVEPFEIPKNIWLEPKSFNERNILSHVLFIKRHAFKQEYANQIALMYSEGQIYQKELLQVSIASSSSLL